MSGGKKQRKKRRTDSSLELSDANKNQKRIKNTKYALILVANSILFLSAYWLLVEQSFFMVVLWTYMILTIGFTSAYIIYNRAFSRRNVTHDMLPDSMTSDEKDEFIADGERRLEKSKWMLTIIIPLLFTFCFDLIRLYVLDPFFSW